MEDVTKDYIKSLETENELLRAEIDRMKKDYYADPFRVIKGQKQIAKYMRWSVFTLRKYLDDLITVGAVGYEYSNYNNRKRMVAVPYLIMKYYRERNYQFLQEKGERLAETTTIPATKSEKEIAEIKDKIDHDLATMEGALEKYKIDFDFIADKLHQGFNDPDMSFAEERKRLDMVLKILGGYQKVTKELKQEVVYKWSSGDDGKEPDEITKRFIQKQEGENNA